MAFTRNNLDQSLSPYLRQHSDNPVWWQEWSPEALAFARERDRVVLVSVGYSTCHWCHVMAREAFSDPECARLLNSHFVPIKVDREQRPDIDHYMMSFLVATTGSGGWPLNVFLTPDGRPFFAMTYASTEPRFDMPGFADILTRVLSFYRDKGSDVREFNLNGEHSRVDAATRDLLERRAPESSEPPVAMIGESDERDILRLVDELERSFDTVHGGFGSAQKFPPHASLLFLQQVHAADLSEQAGRMAMDTLDAMMTRGLHDHLQGGFFRYTVDREWTIPHFEKMLYDQAMLLWNYSIATRLFGRAGYRETAAGVLRALEETFRVGDGYASAHDADTSHREGATYLWKLDEIEALLDGEELDAALRIYSLSRDGNFESRNHLVRNIAPGVHDDSPRDARRAPAPDLMERVRRRLLAARREREQPERDDKIILGWNALTGCALLAAHRYAGLEGAYERAKSLARFLVDRFVRDTVGHALLGDELQEQEYLRDVGALLLFLAMLGEEGPGLDEEYAPARATLRARLERLQNDGVWLESVPGDFPAVPADPFDQPVPSGISLASHALLLEQMRDHQPYEPHPFLDAHARSFGNLSALASRGFTYVVESPQPVPWDTIPVNSVQVHGDGRTSCYRGVCYLGLPPKKTG